MVPSECVFLSYSLNSVYLDGICIINMDILRDALSDVLNAKIMKMLAKAIVGCAPFQHGDSFFLSSSLLQKKSVTAFYN